MTDRDREKLFDPLEHKYSPDYQAMGDCRICGDTQEAHQVTDRDKLFEAVKQAWPTELTYTNYRGETAIRRFFPLYLWWGTTEWHPDPGWLLHAWDTDKKAERDFAMAGFTPPTTSTINELEPVHSVINPPERCPHCGSNLVADVTECMECHVSSEEPPEPRAQCSNCHHYHPDGYDSKYLYGSGLCHLKTEYHKHTKRESSRNWCSAHKPKGE